MKNDRRAMLSRAYFELGQMVLHDPAVVERLRLVMNMGSARHYREATNAEKKRMAEVAKVISDHLILNSPRLGNF